ncbi:hypothetical protein C8J57DRAFT_1217139 [Mycena rebaudengoi]|nr:hypothetical protein C8J57DRAFT_1217139 [Mycena rebaudengoi]
MNLLIVLKRNQAELAEKARRRMAKHRANVEADPVISEEYRLRAKKSERLYHERHAVTRTVTQRIYHVNKSYKGASDSHRQKMEAAGAPQNYEEELQLYKEIQGDQKWQQSLWGKAALVKATDSD